MQRHKGQFASARNNPEVLALEGQKSDSSEDWAQNTSGRQQEAM